MGTKTEEVEEEYRTENIPVDELDLEEPKISNELRQRIHSGAVKAMRKTMAQEVGFTHEELEAFYLDLIRRTRGEVYKEPMRETDEYYVWQHDDLVRASAIERMYDGKITDENSEIVRAIHRIDFEADDNRADPLHNGGWITIGLKG